MYRTRGALHGCLQKNDSLPILLCNACPSCSRLIPRYESLRQHCNKKHGGISRAEVRALEQVPCQSLRSFRFEGSPFQVSLEVSPLSNFQAALTSHGPGDVDATDVDFTNDRDMSSSVSLTKSQSLLAEHDLNVEEAAALIRTPRIYAERTIAKLTARVSSAPLEYFRETRNLSQDVGGFRCFQMVISTSGVYKKCRPFRFLIDDPQGNCTAKMYARRAKLVILVVCRTHAFPNKYSGIRISPEIKNRVSTFLETCSEEKSKYKNNLHRLLFAIFFEQGTFNQGARSLFSSVVGTYLCTYTNTGDRTQFLNGSITWSRLAGILYCVSCCAALESMKYSPKEKREDTICEKMAKPKGYRGSFDILRA